MVVLDDLHWADRSTLALFEFLATEVTEFLYPVAFVGVYRPAPVAASHGDDDGDGEHPLVGVRAALREATDPVEVELDSLSAGDTRALLASTLGRQRLPESFVEAVHERTGGVPLFVRETGAHLLETGVVDPDAREYPDAGDDVELPATVTDTVADRLAGLDAESRRLVRLGAVAGQCVPVAVLAAASDLPAETFEEYVGTLEAGRIWRRRSARAPEGSAGDDASRAVGEELRFAAGGLREAVLETLPTGVADRLHRQVATAMDATYDDADAHAAELAGHYGRAGEHERAVELYRRAGDRAREQYANEAAVQNYRRALELARSELGGVAGDDDATAAALSLAAVHRLVGDYEDAVAVLGALPAERLSRTAAFERTATLGRIEYRRGEYGAAESHAETCLETAREAGDRTRVAEARSLLGQVARKRGDHDRAETNFEDALSTAEAVGDRRLEADILGKLSTVYVRRGEYDRAERYRRRALDVEREVGDRHGEADSLRTLGGIAQQRGAYADAEDRYRRALEIDREVGDRHAEAMTLSNLGAVAKASGDLDRAEEYYERSVEIRHTIGDRGGLVVSFDGLGNVAVRRGDHERASEHYERSLTLAREVGDRYREAVGLLNTGANDLRRGAYDRAEEYLERAVESMEDVGDPTGAAVARARLGEVAVERGEYDAARARLTTAADELRRLGAVAHLLKTLRALVELERDAGDPDAAGEYCERALDVLADHEGGLDDHREWFETTREALSE